MSDTYVLWCLVEGDNGYFPVIVLSTIVVAKLQKAIKKEKPNVLKGVGASNLTLWRVRYLFGSPIYHRASSLPTFRGTIGCMFERCFLASPYSNPVTKTSVLLCSLGVYKAGNTCKSPKGYKLAADQAKLRLQPLEKNMIIDVYGHSNFANRRIRFLSLGCRRHQHSPPSTP